MTRILAGWVTWIRDEMIHPNLHGVDEKKFVPYFLYVFFFAGNDLTSMGYAVSPPAVGLSVFIMIIEGFVALLQAYIFTQLTIMFVGSSVHPEH
jgi:F0F1-type ATP synthase membrane subunit a